MTEFPRDLLMPLAADTIFGMSPMVFVVIAASVLIALAMTIVLARNYHRVPPNKALIITGSVGSGSGVGAVAGGAAFVWPFIQQAHELSLESLTVRIADDDHVVAGDWMIHAPGAVTVGVSLDPEVLQTAAARLLDAGRDRREELARESILESLREAVPPVGAGRRKDDAPDGEKVRERFREALPRSLAKHGLELVTFNVQQVHAVDRRETVTD